MPLSKLEYTNNIKISHDYISSFFKALHEMMTSVIQTDLATCNSSATILDHFCIADGNNEGGFIVLYIQILPGRNEKQKNDLQEKAAEQLERLLTKSKCLIDMQIRVLINEVNKALYEMRDYQHLIC